MTTSEEAWAAFCNVVANKGMESLVLGENREAVRLALNEAIRVVVLRNNEKWQKLAKGLSQGWLDENGNFHPGS